MLVFFPSIKQKISCYYKENIYTIKTIGKQSRAQMKQHDHQNSHTSYPGYELNVILRFLIHVGARIQYSRNKFKGIIAQQKSAWSIYLVIKTPRNHSISFVCSSTSKIGEKLFFYQFLQKSLPQRGERSGRDEMRGMLWAYQALRARAMKRTISPTMSTGEVTVARMSHSCRLRDSVRKTLPPNSTANT